MIQQTILKYTTCVEVEYTCYGSGKKKCSPGIVAILISQSLLCMGIGREVNG